MNTLKWTGSRGQLIELRAECKTELRPREINLDGDIIIGDPEPYTNANLELWVDGKLIDSCWNIHFWRLIDVTQMPGYKKIWGIKAMGMTEAQAVLVDNFLKSVIEAGKPAEIKSKESADELAKKEQEIKRAERTLAAAKTTRKNQDGTLMTNQQARDWQRAYNYIVNEGGEGYVPNVITAEQVAEAQRVLSEVSK